MVPTLHIYLLGDFKLISGETAVNVDVPRIQSLLAYLALHHDTPQSRSQLAYLFWPDTTDAQAHSNLRTLVHRLRQALPNADAFLQVERQHLQWKPQHAEVSWTLDVLDFEHALLQAEQAVALYRGDLLLSCYEEWIFPEHDRLRQAFLRALERLIDLLQQERNDEEAIRVAQRLLRHDPLHEPTYRQLMRLYTAKGNRATALRVYHSCASLLERELGTEPNRATRQVYERLLHAEERIDMPVAPQLPLVAGTPLIGRKPEWAQLQAAWRDAPTRGAHMIVLSGEAGIGKTRLAEELLNWVDRQGTENMAAAIARCYVAEGELAYAPVAAWLRMAAWLRSDALRASLSRLADTWLTEVARLVPDLLVDRPDLPHPGPLAEGWQRERLFEALAKAILGTETSSSPNAQLLLLLLDDLQWCDHETLEWLHYLFRFDPRAPLLLVGTLRQEEIVPGHPLRALSMALQRNKQVTEIPLGELGESETTALAAQVAGHQLDPSAAVALYKEEEPPPGPLLVGPDGRDDGTHRADPTRRRALWHTGPACCLLPVLISHEYQE